MSRHQSCSASYPSRQQVLAAQPRNLAPASQRERCSSHIRQRASRACKTCHARKVRCDASSLGVPCTNCAAFPIQCHLLSRKRKKAQGAKVKDAESERYKNENRAQVPSSTATCEPRDKEATHGGIFAQFTKPNSVRDPIKESESGQVRYLGESCNLSLLVQDFYGTASMIHYPLPRNMQSAKAYINALDNVEIDILRQRGAFLLPPRALCDELVDAFFKWVAPMVPVVNQSRFMYQYRNPMDPPSLLLLQALLMAGSRVCANPQLMDCNGSTTHATITFYKRAKALYDANYEHNQVTIVQSAILMGWYSEAPDDASNNVFYWNRVGITVAQDSGMHRSTESCNLSKTDKRLWKRIWWTLFSHDRLVAVALGRPVAIKAEDCDLEMISEDDFNEDEPDQPADYPPGPVHVQFFINYVKLCKIIGLVLSLEYSVASKHRQKRAIDLAHADIALADWQQHCPPDAQWDDSHHCFWAALLCSTYYTTLCLLHRAHMPGVGSPESNAYTSQTVAYQAATKITSIVENLGAHDELRYMPAFFVYSLSSALSMHIYQMQLSSKSIASATEHRLQICMDALNETSKVWCVAKMVYTVYDRILGNSYRKGRLQKATDKHRRKDTPSPARPSPPKLTPEPPLCKLDDMDFDFLNITLAPQVPYEPLGLKPQTDTPLRDLPQQRMPDATIESTQTTCQSSDPSMGMLECGTRPTTSSDCLSSHPGTPPTSVVVSRDPPNITRELQQNMQPHQLFPSDSQMDFLVVSPAEDQSPIDPDLAQPQSTLIHPRKANMRSHSVPQQQTSGQQRTQNAQPMPPMPEFDQKDPHVCVQQMVIMTQYQQGAGPNGAQSDRSTRDHEPISPTTLNVEDWFCFYGLNSEANTF